MTILGKVWRLLVGIKDGLVLLFMLLFFALLYAALSATPSPGRVGSGALLVDIRGMIVEQPSETDPLSLATDAPRIREYRLRDLVHALRAAATDDRVKAVALDLDTFVGGGQGAMAEVADAIDLVRRADKPVVAYATGYTDDGYQLAAHASEIWINPLGLVAIAGRGGANLYYAGLLEKLGVTPNVYRVGTYKAAVEPYTRSDMSPESREASQALADTLWENWLDDVRRARPKAAILPYVAATADRIAAAGGDMAKAALADGLVDRIGDRTAFGKRMAELAGVDDADVPGSFKTIDYAAWVAANPAGSSSGAVGVITVAGTIVDGKAGPGTAGGDTIAETLAKGISDNNLKALVVRIDSPGGSVIASERIRQAVLDAKSTGLPVVVSMGSTAASGGYWIASAGDHILAQPETLTGSIGVFAVLPSFQGSLDKLGLGADGVATTPLSGQPDLLRGPSPEVERLLQQGVDGVYARFLSLVSASRKMPAERVDRIAQGRVWDGGTARQLGLVDGFGTLGDAVAEAARRAGLDPVGATPLFLEREPTLVERLTRMFGDANEEASPDIFARAALKSRLTMTQAVADARMLVEGPAMQARCLECPAGAPARAPAGGFLAWLARVSG